MTVYRTMSIQRLLILRPYGVIQIRLISRWPACWVYACSGSLPLDLHMFNYCIILLFMLWRIKFSLSIIIII